MYPSELAKDHVVYMLVVPRPNKPNRTDLTGHSSYYELNNRNTSSFGFLLLLPCLGNLLRELPLRRRGHPLPAV